MESEMGEVTSERTRIRDLTRAFNLFRKEMGRLAAAYSALKRQFQQVNLELEQKVAELDATTAYLRGILDSMTQGILFIDQQGVITTCNPAAEKILGCSATSLLQTSYFDHYKDDQFGFSVRQAMEGEEQEAIPTSLTWQDGAVRHLEVSASLARNGLILLLRDRTEVRLLQMRAERNDRLKELGEMAAAVAHEIRNPLGGIRGFASLLQRDLAENPHLERMAAAIVQGTSTLDQLVSNVLAYAKPFEVQLTEVDLRGMVKEVYQLVTADTQLAHGIAFKLKLPKRPIRHRVDRTRLKGALLNLVVNGCQAIEESGSLTIELNEEGRISVADTGCGIRPDDLEKVFSPFFTTKERGNGLGLAEVHKVVTAHGGTVGVTSEEGVGSLFWIKIGRENGH